MTFLGRFRGGREVEPHLHEAPAIMTGPLAVLGVLSVVGGALNLPSFVGGSHKLEHWLEPVTEPATRLMDALVLPHGSTELMLVGGAVAIALIGLALGLRVTMRGPIEVPAMAPPETGIWRLLHGKYFIDELYGRLFVGPTVWFSRTVLWKGFDQFLVDRLGVGGTARVAQGLGWLGSRLQNGQVALYVTLFAVGVVIILRTLA